MNAEPAPGDEISLIPTDRPPAARAILETLARNTASNLKQWSLVLAPAPRARNLRPPLPGYAFAVAVTAAVVVSMFVLDAAATDWAHRLPYWINRVFEKVTDLGLSGWFLVPFGFAILCLAALVSAAVPRIPQAVLTALAARCGFLFLAIGVPGLFDTIIKRFIGRARPSVGGHDDPFAYRPLVWRSDYASLPSGHATTAVAAAIALGAIWPRTRPVMWVYAFTIMLSRVVVIAHHPSDVLAGALVGLTGAALVRRWFAARRLLFRARDLRPYPGPSLRRIVDAVIAALRALPTSSASR